MAEPRGFVLSPEFAERVQRSVAWTEQRHDNPPPTTPTQRPSLGGSNIQRLRITDDVPTTESSVDYYEADVLRWDVAAGTWSVVADASPVQVFDPAGGTFAVDDELDARMVGSGDIGGQTYPVFEKMTGGGTGTEKLFRVTSFFLQDTNPPVGSPSPHCFYPVVEQTPTAASGFPADGTLVAWWISPYSGAYSIFPPVGVPGAPTTIVKADGTGYVTGIPTGWSYAPQNNGTPAHPNNGASRPVYMDARYASMWAIACDPITGAPIGTLGDG
jgi:hypothetical protein